ncbi:DUF3566 domain-containing protein [Gordonia sp. w5E2]|uniref:DUF3566 domain-containing protein n=1 Tax=Gordonia sputi NBRC 100414 TaxID=1089453 RepID=H5U0M3_9ACTN|nr:MULTISPECIES: DUF3566 domain-containing protein [Gordonia]NKY94278.1 hypothetical protein [Gordonia sputi]GAB39291.1 hypothetical protein GOSPT_062_00260 [Gordonia sputi NBRC 100414]
MSTPNDPDDKKSTTGRPSGPTDSGNPGGPARSSGPGPSGAQNSGSDAVTHPSMPSKNQSPVGAPKQGGLVPPWQRGGVPPQAPNGQNGPPPNGGLPPNGKGGPPPSGKGGPPPRGMVTSEPAGGQAPVTKLDNPARTDGPSRPAASSTSVGGGTGARTGFVESPTRTIVRDPSEDEQLPDLDQIHHTAEVRQPAEVAAAAAPRPAPAQVGHATALRAAVQIRRIDPWATFKISAVLAVVGFFIWMIAVAVLYLILDGMGVWDQINSSFGTLVTADGSSSEGDVIGAGTIFGYAVLLGAINAILLTAIATIGAYIYNLCADLVGGAEVTLGDLD